MRLKTKIEGTCLHVYGVCVDEYDTAPYQVKDLEHDAAAAHALMQAIDEIGTRGIQDADEIADRADELMREWGYK